MLFPKRLSLILAIIVLLLGACGQPTATAVVPVPTPAPTRPTAFPYTPESMTPTPIPTPEPAPLYKDPTAPIAARVDDLLARMTLPEKIGQMTQVEKNSIRYEDITAKFIGSLLSGGGGYPEDNSPAGWANMVDTFQNYALRTRLGIPLIYGVDAVHGHAAVRGAVVFPHNIGLGAAGDPDLVERVARATAEEMAATGVYWNFGPVLAVPQDIRWGRTYEGFAENTELVSALGSAYVRGLQNIDGTRQLNAPTAVLATPKHYVGDGGTAWGSSKTFIQRRYMLDQGVTEVDEATLRRVHLPPYAAAIQSGAMSVMVSFSSWGGMKMHAQKYLLTDVLKGELGFQGFLVSDWAGIGQISEDPYHNVVTAINAGLDMIMVPYDYNTFIDNLTQAVEKGDVPLARIDDAVRRILKVKFALGLFERPFADASLQSLAGSAAHRELAREAVRKSLVLLKNDNATLPLAKDTPSIFIAGQGADDIGMQCGGWTIEWQGRAGDITPGTTILQAIRSTVAASTRVVYDRGARFGDVVDSSGKPAVADVGIVVIGEQPYAEGVGDREDLSLSPDDLTVLEQMRPRCKKLVVVLLAGRPLIVTDQLPNWDAFVAAWLPGTEGQGVVDALFGDSPFTGKLPYTWPRSMDQLPFDFAHMATSGPQAPLFAFGYGLEK